MTERDWRIFREDFNIAYRVGCGREGRGVACRGALLVVAAGVHGWRSHLQTIDWHSNGSSYSADAAMQLEDTCRVQCMPQLLQ
jgi:hypothetical protein